MRVMKTTLLLLVKDGKILLAEKKRGFGQGKFNGVGGKVEPGETIDEAMLRETKEEIGIVPTNYEERAVLNFDEFMKGERTIVETHVYVADSYQGEPVESDEMKPFWFDLEAIPYGKMFPDDKFWLPKLLAGEKFSALFVFNENFEILSYKFNELK